MKIVLTVLAVICWAVVPAQRFAADRPAGEPVPSALRELAARAGTKVAWPQLRAYADSRKVPEQRDLAYFVLGYREYQAGEYPQAAEDLRKAANVQFTLADYASYYSASAAFKAGNSAQATEGVRGFATDYPASTFRAQALQLLAQALVGSQKAPEAVQILTADPGVRRHPESALLLAQAYWQAGDQAQAARAFQDVYYAFPSYPQAKAAEQALGSLRPVLGAKFPEPSEEIVTARLELLFRASLYKEALKGYEGQLTSKPGNASAGEWQLGRARCLLHLRRDSEALEVLSGSLATPALNAERLALRIEAYTRANDSSATLDALAQIQAIDSHSTSYESALNSAGDSSTGWATGKTPRANTRRWWRLSRKAATSKTRDGGLFGVITSQGSASRSSKTYRII